MPFQSSIANIGNSITVLESTESTNNYAMAKVHAGLAKHGDTWLAMEQTAGKGQRGRAWKSSPGENIILSAVLEPGFLSISHQFSLSMCIALGCHDFFAAYAGDETRIKWPNDLYWRDRKAGGILIENILKAGYWEFAVVGIGININQVSFSEDLRNPVSLKQITGKTFDPMILGKELCDSLEHRYRQLKEDKNTILKEYNEVLYKREEQVKLRNNNVVFETTIKSVNEQGRLLTYDTLEHEFDLGEIEWIL